MSVQVRQYVRNAHPAHFYLKIINALIIARLEPMVKLENVRIVPQGVQTVQVLQLVRNVQMAISRMKHPV